MQAMRWPTPRPDTYTAQRNTQLQIPSCLAPGQLCQYCRSIKGSQGLQSRVGAGVVASGTLGRVLDMRMVLDGIDTTMRMPRAVDYFAQTQCTQA